MHNIALDAYRNRLYLTLSGGENVDMPSFVQEIETACNALYFGFSCMAILKKSQAVSQKDLDLLFRVADLISAYGAGRFVFVDQCRFDSTTVWANLVHFPCFIPVDFARNIKEGEKILDASTPEDFASIPFQSKKPGTDSRTYTMTGSSRHRASYLLS